ncbi:hypothetical protein MPSEU_000136500 [Mayamaea pseudoterrestris]|nr:hypothetical protein MPSEU_000136500 [Mayamaea pseudoterrestris]
MGDSRITIAVSKSLITHSVNRKDNSLITICHDSPADTSLRELFERATVECENRTPCTLWSLLIDHDGVSIWDCTMHPPKDVTDWPLGTFAETTGLRSKTLFDAGWFPSGKIYILANDVSIHDAIGVSQDKYDDRQYNNQQIIQDASDNIQTRVQLVGNDLPLGQSQMPSQVLSAVTKRFMDDHQDAEQALAAAKMEQRRNKMKATAKERERNRKLDERIQKLDQQAQGKSKTVSEQVQRMLIKSRATGRPELQQHDRLYFRCLVLDGIDDESAVKEEYRYFSPQDTMGRIASSFTVSADKQTELLVRRRVMPALMEHCDGIAFDYRRLPTLQRLHEAVFQGFISEFDRLVIRVYDADNEAPTASVEEVDSFTIENTESGGESMPIDADCPQVATNTKNSCAKDGFEVATGPVYDRIMLQFTALDAKSKGKKPSAAAVKVRQMQMKSKATGDAKRIKNVMDRFFVELIMAVDDGNNVTLTSSHIFLARTDTIERILADFPAHLCGSGWNNEFLVVTESALHRVTDTNMPLAEAERRGILKCFDPIILRIYKES